MIHRRQLRLPSRSQRPAAQSVERIRCRKPHRRRHRLQCRRPLHPDRFRNLLPGCPIRPRIPLRPPPKSTHRPPILRARQHGQSPLPPDDFINGLRDKGPIPPAPFRIRPQRPPDRAVRHHAVIENRFQNAHRRFRQDPVQLFFHPPSDRLHASSARVGIAGAVFNLPTASR